MSSFEALIDELVEQELFSDYGICVAATLFIYDYILTFQQEKEVIWNWKWTYGKVMFLFIRYSGFLVIACWFFATMGRPVSLMSCKVLEILALCTATTVILLGCLILALRTWAIWDRNIYCGLLVGAGWLLVTIPVWVYLAWTVQDMLPYENVGSTTLAGCGATNSPEGAVYAVKSYGFLAAFEGLIVILTIARGITNFFHPTPLLMILYRDAFLGSIAVLTLTTADAILASQDSTRFYLAYLTSVAFYYIIPCRIILNLRQQVTCVDKWELATTQAY